LTKLTVKVDGVDQPVAANHALRRGYATAARQCGVEEDNVSKLLHHGSKKLINRYIKDSAHGKMLLEAQQKTSTAIVKALGNPAGMA
jgi:activator of 2-hydroxyglutaryl-CoA dehydratase